MKIIHTEDVDALRRAAYPPLEAFVDAYYHAMQGDDAKMLQYLERCREVKSVFSKP